MEKTIGFIGFGHIANAVAEGLLLSGSVERGDILAYDVDETKLRCMTHKGVLAATSVEDLVAHCRVVVIAVTAKAVPELTKSLAGLLDGKILVSFAAGYGFKEYSELLPDSVHRISAIPNIPFKYGAGMLLCEDVHSLDEVEYEFFKSLFKRAAEIETVQSSCFNAAGTLSGCSPAYVAMFVEALADAGVKHGVPRRTAYKIAAQIAVGAGTMCKFVAPSEVKDDVCSPGGTTIKGVAALEKNGFRGSVISAIDAILDK